MLVLSSVAGVGQAASAAAGTVFPISELLPIGQFCTGVTGTVFPGTDCFQVGEQAVGAQGSLELTIAASLLGIASAGGAGTVTPSGGDGAPDTDDFFALRRRRKFGRTNTPLVTQWPPRRIR